MTDSKLFKVNTSDVTHAAINAVIAAIVVGLYGVVTTPNFDLFSADWGSILRSVINWAFAGFVGSIGKKFLSDSDGTVHLGAVKIAK